MQDIVCRSRLAGTDAGSFPWSVLRENLFSFEIRKKVKWSILAAWLLNRKNGRKNKVIQRFLSLELTERLLSNADIEIVFLDETGSTNDDLKQRARQHALHRPVLEVAYTQKAGRGTKGRSWCEPTCGLYFSIGLPVTFRCGLSAIAAGLAVVCAARRFGIELSLKWPNDLWANDGKAGGILCEAVQDNNGQTSLIVGIGCNLVVQYNETTTNGWPIRDFRNAGGATLAVDPEARTAFLAAVTLEVIERLKKLSNEIYAAQLREDWAAADAFFGRVVTWTSGDGIERTGIDRGIDEDGRLMLESFDDFASASGRWFCLSGEICALKNK